MLKDVACAFSAFTVFTILAKCTNQQELNEVCRQHESLKVKYSQTLYDSRCVIFGINPDGTICHTPQSSDVNVNGGSCVEDSGIVINGKEEEETDSLPPKFTSGRTSPTAPDEGIQLSQTDESNVSSPSPSRKDADDSKSNGSTCDNADQPLTTPNNFKTRPLFYSSEDNCDNLESDMSEFISSLFWVLESKRLDKSYERQERIPLLCAPFERNNFVGIDMDSRSNRRRCLGRIKKQMGDLSLQAGIQVEAMNYYISASDSLKAVNDWLWLAGKFTKINI